MPRSQPHRPRPARYRQATDLISLRRKPRRSRPKPARPTSPTASPDPPRPRAQPQELDLTIPRDKLTVITGLSGSGKSTVAFDILFNEGQRRYLESLNAYARQFVQPAARPDVDEIFGVPPTVAIEQRTSRGGRKSTVAHDDGNLHFLRLLFVSSAPSTARTATSPSTRSAPRPSSPACSRIPGPAAGAGPAGGGPQGLLHRSRQMGGRQGLRAPAGGRRTAAHR